MLSLRGWNTLWICLPLLAAPVCSQAAIISAEPNSVGADGQYFEAASTNNVVLWIPLLADAGGDTLQSLTVVNSFNYPPAVEPDDIAANSVRVWYADADTGSLNTATAVYVSSLTFNGDRGNPSWSRSGLSQWVGNGGALYITVDISSTPTPDSACSFQINASDLVFASGSHPSAQSPVQPTLLLITPYFAVDLLQANHSNTAQIILSTGQSFSPTVLRMINPGTPLTAPVYLSGLTLTVRDANGAPLAPNTALDILGLRDADTGMLLSQIGPLPAAPGPCFLPLSTSVTAVDARRLEVFGTVCSNTTAAVSAFRLDWDAAPDLSAQDAYSGLPVSVVPYNDSFPMSSNVFYVQSAAYQINVSHVPVMAANDVVIKGQSAVNPLNFVFRNPGNTGTARVDITRLTLFVSDADGVTLTPASVFSRVALTSAGGGIVYGETSDLPTTGSLITLTLTNSFCSVPAYQAVTAYVQVDIRPDATAVDFRIALPNAGSVKAQDSNSLLPVPAVNDYGSDLFPMYSNPIRVASSFLVSGLSQAPKTLYPNQTAGLLDLTFTHPGPSDLGILLLQGLTVTARDRAGAALAPGRDLAEVAIVDGGGNPLARVVPAPGAFEVYLPLGGLSVAPNTSLTVRLQALVAASPLDAVISLGVDGRDAVDATQPSDPTRPVFVAGAWPLLSAPASLGGGEGRLRLSNYPNPFAAGRDATRIAYYLESPATVTATLYTLAGDQVRSFCRGALQTAGEHVWTWDGRTEAGAGVVNGVYLLRIEAALIGAGETVTQLRKIAVVK